MYDDTGIPKNEESGAPSEEEVTPLQTLYEGTVASYLNPHYFTVSPNISRHSSLSICLNEWRDTLRRSLYKVCRDYVYTLEMAGGIRPHYHGVCDVIDRIGFTKKMFIMSQYDNVKVHKPFKKGIGYMFKEVDTTYSLTGQVPVIERDDDTPYYDNKKKERSDKICKRKQEQLDALNSSYPKWMTE